MLKQPEIKLFEYLNIKKFKEKINKVGTENPALFMFLLVSVIGIGGCLLHIFDHGFASDTFNVKIQEEKTYSYKAEELINSGQTISGYKINFDKNSLKFNDVNKGPHSIENFIKETGACAAINANFFHTDYKQLGLYSDNYNKCTGCPERGFVDAIFAYSESPISEYTAKNGNYYIIKDEFSNTNANFPSGLSRGVSGKLVIANGEELPQKTNANSYSYIGWDKSGEIYAFSFDPSSASIQIKKMIEEGISYAIMLDGGGSSQMYSVKGTVNDSTKVKVIRKDENEVARSVPFYIGSGNCREGENNSGEIAPISQKAECKDKAGFNTGDVFLGLNNSKYYERLKTYGMNSILGIAESLDSDLASASSFVELANANGVTPVIRFCFGSSSCDNYKDPQDMATFIRELSKAGKFAVILGPNEPNLETWKGTDFFEIGKFSAEVANKVKDLNQIELLSIVFDTAHHLNMSLKNDPTSNYPEISQVADYFKGLGDKQLLDGIAMNAYNKDRVLASDRVDYFLNYLKTNGYGLENNFSKVYITEFGYFKDSMPSIEQLKQSYSALSSRSDIASILFFTPFNDIGNQDFPSHHLSSAELFDILGTSDDCKTNNAEQPVVTPITDPRDQPVPISGSGLVVNTKLEYCSPGNKQSSKNCIPYTKYYDEPKSELLSCQTEGLGEINKSLSTRIKLKYDQASNSYKGEGVLVGRIRNFPMLRHFGSGSFGEGGFTDPATGNYTPFTSEGTSFNPYQPVCSFLSEQITENGSSIHITNEFSGKVVFYDEDGSSYEYAMPRLGNGISCLNILSTTNPLSMNSGNLAEDYAGFSVLNMTEKEKKIAHCRSKHAQMLQNGASYKDIIEVVKNDLECQDTIDYGYKTIDTASDDQGIYTMAYVKEGIYPPKSGEPYFFYGESKTYCEKSTTYKGMPLKFLNKGLNFSNESFRGPSNVIRLDKIDINVSEECTKIDNLFRLKSEQGSSLKSSICSGGAVNDVYYELSYKVPTSIGIPGGISAYTSLVELVQRTAETKLGKIITPVNAVQVIGQFFVYPNEEGNELVLGDRISDDYQNNLTPEEIRNSVTTVYYYMPYMDYQPLFTSLQDVLNGENEDAIY
ncbi:phosphodiester glycosidase family protein [Candidatus Dojkabacteria bacterium]|nr:phosphodiester glycosidase family protein [Candidatus Dojkabacteria bacterium]